jgi:uncharacterized DUF497 family protein
VRIVWDEPKRLANIANHEMDFADLDETFFENSVVTPAKFDRLAAVGRYHTGIILVVFVELGPKRSAFISMRPASRKERRLLDG